MASMSSSTRFRGPVTDADEKEMRSKAIPGKTKATTDWGGGWKLGMTRHLLDRYPQLKFNLEFYQQPHYWICLQMIWPTGWGKFVLEIHKQNGSEYPPKSLYAMVCCFKWFYNQNECYDVNPLCSTDERFGKFQSTLDAHCSSSLTNCTLNIQLSK